jgi:hypothetical protein
MSSDSVVLSTTATADGHKRANKRENFQGSIHELNRGNEIRCSDDLAIDFCTGYFSAQAGS